MTLPRNADPQGDSAACAIAQAIQNYLNTGRIHTVVFAELGNVIPPQLAYITPFPRLSVTFTGCHSMELIHHGKACTIRATQGTAVLVGCNRWNKPDWTEPTHVLTFLLGRRQIGVSLVTHPCQTIIKTTIQCPPGHLFQNLVHVLTELEREPVIHPPLDGLLVEAFLHTCSQQLQAPTPYITRKGLRTHEMICMFIQENSHDPRMTRDTVAQHFGLNATHISRLFKAESGLRFTDYLNSVRIRRAERLLLHHDLSVKEAASLAGYGDHAYFCRMFKKQTQQTPTEYKLKSVNKT